jgi:site-specific DNA recombinase
MRTFSSVFFIPLSAVFKRQIASSRRSPQGWSRCVRKSSEEGLEQSFNSLDAQREACHAFVASQREEGWRAIPTRYDDGGFSGGNLTRPALRRLLADVEAKKVDTIVVYKVDRLTRSLADFAKIVEAWTREASLSYL